MKSFFALQTREPNMETLVPAKIRVEHFEDNVQHWDVHIIFFEYQLELAQGLLVVLCEHRSSGVSAASHHEGQHAT